MDRLITKFCASFCFYETDNWASLTFLSGNLKIALGFVVASLLTCFTLASYFYENASRANLSDVITSDWYTVRDMVVCIDNLSSDNNSTSNESKPVHFVFIGDSRIRQHFLNFFKVK